MRPRIGTGTDRHLSLGALALAATLGLLGLGRPAQAAGQEPTLFLGIQRYTALDKLLTEQLGEYLSDHGEQILKSPALSDAERRCRQPQCSEALALDQRATFVLSGEVSSAGPNRTLRVQVRLFDVRRRGTAEALNEKENLCTDCDDTKLGIVLTSTTNELLASYRLTATGLAPMNYPTPGPAPGPAPAPAAAPAAGQAPAAAPYAAPAAPVQAQPPADAPPLSTSPLAVPMPPEPPAAPPQPAPAQQPVPAQQPAPLNYYPPPTQQLQQPAPAQPGSVFAQRKGLSKTRKAVAAVFGVLGFGSLIVAGVMTGLDHKLAPNYAYNPTGAACSAPENLGRTCVLSTVGLYAPLYAVGGLLVGGMILTLAIPEIKPTPASE